MNNLKHISASYRCDSRTVLTDMARDLCRILFTFFLFVHWNSATNCTPICVCVLYCICWICVPYWNVNFFVITHYHFCNIATWTACVHHVGFHVLRNKWYMPTLCKHEGQSNKACTICVSLGMDKYGPYIFGWMLSIHTIYSMLVYVCKYAPVEYMDKAVLDKHIFMNWLNDHSVQHFGEVYLCFHIGIRIKQRIYYWHGQ